MEKIDIRKLSKIGVSNIQQKASSETEKVKLRIGVFFDGTGNNKFNSESMYYKENLPLDESTIKDIKKKVNGFVPESGSSYWNSYSNIALLFDLYEEKQINKSEESPFYSFQQKLYVEGIGTLKYQKDDMKGSGFGEGIRGVITRVEEACQNIADKIEEALKAIKTIHPKKSIEIVSIQFDVFGFSRGAAAARHFCNEVLKTGREEIIDRFGKINDRTVIRQDNQKNTKIKDLKVEAHQYKANATKKVKDNLVVSQKYVLPTNQIFTGGILGKLLKKKKIGFPKHHVSIEFLGIFDTVISQMLERKGIIDITRKPINQLLSTVLSPVLGILTEAVASIKKVNPNLSNPNIKKILHIKAQTEWRDNFPITPIGEIKNSTYAKEISVLGAHSDIGGGYWQIKQEKNTLHFFDISTNADSIEKQKLEQQKDLLRNWYISQKLCKKDQLEWKIMHHVQAFKTYANSSSNSSILPPQYLLLDSNFMGQSTVKTENNTIYTLVGYHHILVSTRPLNNKLSLVYMNLMKYIATTYAEVPFSEPNDKLKEYIFPRGDKKGIDLENYLEFIKKVTEHGWTDKNGKTTTYPDLIDKDNLYSLTPEMYDYIMGKFVHLSANFTTPLLETFDHYNFAYANVPHFTDEKEFKEPPYKRQTYTPSLDTIDIS